MYLILLEYVDDVMVMIIMTKVRWFSTSDNLVFIQSVVWDIYFDDWCITIAIHITPFYGEYQAINAVCIYGIYFIHDDVSVSFINIS